MREKKDNIWKYFKNNKDEGIAICNECGARLKNNRTYNLNSHLKKLHHKNHHNEELSSKVSISPSSSNVRKRKIKIEINKKQIFRSYIGLVTENSVPFSVLNSPNMRALIDPICDGLGSNLGKKFRLNAENCKKTLKMVAENIKKDISRDMKGRLLSLKIDSTTRLPRNIFGISVQFVTDGEINSRILGMVELTGMGLSTSRNLATEILKCLSTYDISLNQIVSITSDNDASMLRATKMLSHCIAAEDCNEDDAEAKNDIYMQNISSLDDFRDIRVGEIQICCCVAQTAQLCALDVIKNAEMKKYLLSCRNLVQFCRKISNGCRVSFESKKIKIPQLDCPTRLGSTYNMLNDLKAAKHTLIQLEPTTYKSAEENFENDDILWEFIESYCTAFNSMQKTIIKFQEEQLHYGDFYAQWLKCKMSTKKLVDNEENKNSFIYKIGSSILQALETRSKQLMCNESLLATLFLDPRFHHTLELAQKNYATTYLKNLWNKVQSQNDEEIQPSTTMYSLSNSFAGDNADEEDLLLDEFLAHGVHTSESKYVTTDVHIKIERLQLPFLRSDTNVLNFWKEKVYSDPELYSLSKICFAIPPAQVTIERAFSTLKILQNENRNRLSKTTLENILLVKLNSTYLDDAINSLPLFEEDEAME